MHNGGHLTLAPRPRRGDARRGARHPLVIGGIVPEQDVDTLRETGVAAILGPGTSTETVVATIRDVVGRPTT